MQRREFAIIMREYSSHSPSLRLPPSPSLSVHSNVVFLLQVLHVPVHGVWDSSAGLYHTLCLHNSTKGAKANQYTVHYQLVLIVLVQLYIMLVCVHV